jgi:hypothetical protein
MTIYANMCGLGSTSSDWTQVVIAIKNRLLYGLGGIGALLNLPSLGTMDLGGPLAVVGVIFMAFGFLKFYDTSVYRQKGQPHWACTGFICILCWTSYLLLGRANRIPEFIYFQF